MSSNASATNRTRNNTRRNASRNNRTRTNNGRRAGLLGVYNRVSGAVRKTARVVGLAAPKATNASTIDEHGMWSSESGYYTNCKKFFDRFFTIGSHVIPSRGDPSDLRRVWDDLYNILKGHSTREITRPILIERRERLERIANSTTANRDIYNELLVILNVLIGDGRIKTYSYCLPNRRTVYNWSKEPTPPEYSYSYQDPPEARWPIPPEGFGYSGRPLPVKEIKYNGYWPFPPV
jgi:hypothetical protein